MKRAYLEERKSGDLVRLEFRFPFSQTTKFQETLQFVKDMPGRTFDKAAKVWYIPLIDDSIVKLEKDEWNIDPCIYDKLEKAEEPINFEMPEGLSLRPYQEEGVKKLLKWQCHALLADDMGLGKTIQAIAVLKVQKKNAIIVCPSSLKLNWMEELQRWAPEIKVYILEGKAVQQLYPKGNQWAYIINYDILSAWEVELDRLIKQSSKMQVIADEAHYLKNQKTKRTQSFSGVVYGYDSDNDINDKNGTRVPVVAMTGTPIENRPIELFNMLRILRPAVFGSWFHFATRYCQGESNGYGINTKGSSNELELHKMLVSTCMIRRLKKDVLTDLPEKTISVIALELGKKEMREYNDADEQFLQWLTENEGKQAAEKAGSAEELVRIQKLKMLSARLKQTNLMDWMEDFLAGEQKVVISCVHHETMDWVQQYVQKEYGAETVVRLDGKKSANEKNEAVKAFQNDEHVKVFIGQIRSAGVGLTLTAASHLAFFELGWTPGEHSQMEDRIHRIGQKNAANIYYLIAKGTIEEDLAEMLDIKKISISKTMDGQTPDNDSLISKLLDKYKKRARGLRKEKEEI